MTRTHRTRFPIRRQRMGGIVATVLALSLFTWSTSTAQDAVIDYPDFSSTTGLTLNGSAAAVGGNLRLVPDLPGQAGSAFWTSPLSTETSFETRFQFQISGTQPIGLRSDGLTFVIQRDPRGAAALGTGGGAIGYGTEPGGEPAITPSVSIEFDDYQNGWDPDDRHVALVLDGDNTNHIVSASLADPLDDGGVRNVQILYDAVSTQLSVLFSEGADPLQLLFFETIDIPALVGDEAWFGFTAGTGGGFADHDLLDWVLDASCSRLEVTGSGLPSTSLVFDLTGAASKAPAFLLIALDTGTQEFHFGPLGVLSLGVVPPWIPVPLGLTDSNGSASWTLPLPSVPLPQLTLFAQATTVTLSHGWPPAWDFCTSNVATFTVGGR